jgi:hypothetical protein
MKEGWRRFLHSFRHAFALEPDSPALEVEIAGSPAYAPPPASLAMSRPGLVGPPGRIFVRALRERRAKPFLDVLKARFPAIRLLGGQKLR